MANDNWGFFVEELTRQIPEIIGVQILTIDGLTLWDGIQSSGDDRLSALTALLSNGAEQLALCLGAEKGGKGALVCMGETSYAVIRLNQDVVLGIQIHVAVIQADLMARIHTVLAANSNIFNN